MNTISVVDLFCGIGGLTHGFVHENMKVVAGIDFDKSCRYAYEKNNNAQFIHSDITTVHSSSINKLFGKAEVRVLVGCAPCQAFSALNQKKTNDKWKMLYAFGRIIKDTKPEIVSMENVPQLLKYDNGKVFDDFRKNLKALGYHVSFSIVNAQNYGVPQRRKRLILFASRLGEIEIIKETHNETNYVTVADAIGKLPPIEDGIAHEKDPLHRARKLSPINKLRIKATPPGGGWKDWDESLLLECHKKATGQSFKSVYGRMKWDDVSPTLTTQCTGLGNGRFGHPQQDRAITIREAAILQSFPLSYKFIDPKENIAMPSIERQIGNAVPVGLGIAIAKTIKKHIRKYAR